MTGSSFTHHATLYIRYMLKFYGVLNRLMLLDHLRSMTQARDSKLYQCPETVLETVLAHESMPFTAGTCVRKTTFGDVARERCRRYLIAAMQQHGAFVTKRLVAIAEAMMRRDAEREITLNCAASGTLLPMDVARLVITELADYHPSERLWHVKTGVVTDFQSLPGMRTLVRPNDAA